MHGERNESWSQRPASWFCLMLLLLLFLLFCTVHNQSLMTWLWRGRPLLASMCWVHLWMSILGVMDLSTTSTDSQYDSIMSSDRRVFIAWRTIPLMRFSRTQVFWALQLLIVVWMIRWNLVVLFGMRICFCHWRNRGSPGLSRKFVGFRIESTVRDIVTGSSPVSLGDELLGGGGSFLHVSPSGTTPEGRADDKFTVSCSGVEILFKETMGELWLVTRSVVVGGCWWKLLSAQWSTSGDD